MSSDYRLVIHKNDVCQKNAPKQSSDSSKTGSGTLSIAVQSKLDEEIVCALADPGFVSKLLKTKFQYWMTA